MVKSIKIFFVTPTDLYTCTLRRTGDPMRSKTCHAVFGAPCAATHMIGTVMRPEPPHSGTVAWDKNDKRWPTHCVHCHNPFDNEAWWIVDYNRIYRSRQHGEMTLKDAPVGACWSAPWLAEHKEWCGPDGRCLIVRLPGVRDWVIDSIASDCHLDRKIACDKCWERTGKPEDGTLSVINKTCACGWGDSCVSTPSWVCRLQDGCLVSTQIERTNPHVGP